MTRTHAAIFPLLLALALTPRPATAQMGPQGGTSRGWAPVEIGVRFGATSVSSNTVFGAQLRIPVIPSGFVELVPNWDVTFLSGLKEYQHGVQAVVVSGGRRGGLYAGGGLTWRNTIYPDASDRETKRWPDVVAGLRTGRISSLPLDAQIQIRWVFVDGPIDPKILTFGVNVPLWGWGRR